MYHKFLRNISAAHVHMLVVVQLDQHAFAVLFVVVELQALKPFQWC